MVQPGSTYLGLEKKISTLQVSHCNPNPEMEKGKAATCVACEQHRSSCKPPGAKLLFRRKEIPTLPR